MISMILYRPIRKMLVPTMVRTQVGVFLERGPVEIADSADTAGCLASLMGARNRGVGTVSHPSVFGAAAKTPSVVAAGAKSWTEFVRNAVLWHIDESPEGSLQICRWYSPAGKNYFVPNLDNTISFVPGTEIEVVFIQAVEQLQMAEREIL
jgi:hypothetical protein